MPHRSRVIKAARKICASISALVVLIASPSQILALELSQSVNQHFFQADSDDNIVTYTLEVKNNNICKQPVEVMILFDRSGSMDDDGQNPPEPITTAKEATYAFIDSMERHVDHVGLVSYADTAKRDSPLRSDVTAVKQLISHLKAGGKTNIGDAMELGIEEFRSPRARDYAKPFIIIFSDGKANRPQNMDPIQYAVDQAGIAKNEGITVISIGLGSDVDANTLIRMASPNGYYYAPTASDMVGIYNRISKSMDGISPNTVVWDDVSNLLPVADFVSASNGGRLENNKVVWDLGDIDCGETRTVNYSFRFHHNIRETYTRTNIFHGNNGANEQFESNSETITVVGPWVTIGKTDNKTYATDLDLLDYLITVNNVGPGYATNVNLSDTLPEFVYFTDSDVPGIYQSGKLLSWNIGMLQAGETKTYRVSGRLILPSLFAGGQIINRVTATNDERSVSAEDITQITLPSEERPNFTTYANCIDLNDEDTFTAYFGYLNRLDSDQLLDESRIEPSSAEGNPPQVLMAGRNDKAFAATADMGTSITWIAKMGNVSKTATASDSYEICQYDGDGSASPQEKPNIDDEPIGGDGIILQPPVDDEEVTFYIDEVNLSSECSTSQINVADGRVTGTSEIAIIEYSMDDGRNWYPVIDTEGLGTKDVKFSIRTPEVEDKLYSFKFKVKTVTGRIFVSNPVSYPHNCSGTATILGSYYQNGFGEGILNKSGNFLYNNDLPATLFVETRGGIPSLNLVLASTAKDLDSQSEDSKTVEMTYDHETDLWYTEIPKGKLTNEMTYAKVTASLGGEELSKDLPQIVNIEKTKESSENLSDEEQKPYDYTIYFYNGLTWEELDYNEELNESDQLYSYQKFNLFPGNYYISVKYPDNRTYYTDKFELESPSVVQVQTTPNALPNILGWVDPLVRQLDVDIFEKNSLIELAEDPSKEEVVTQTGDVFDMYENSLSEATFGAETQDLKLVLFYWNRWNPHFSEQLPAVNELNRRLKDESSDDRIRKVVIITDSNNINELKRVLKIARLDIEVVEVTDSDFLIQEIRYQPEFVVYDSTMRKITRIRGSLNLEEIEDSLSKIDLL